MSDESGPSAPQQLPSPLDQNPFAPSQSASTCGQTANAEQPPRKTPFAFQAVRFSLYAPVLMMATNLFVHASVGDNDPIAKAFAAVSALTIVAAFFLGLIGMVGSLKRLALWSAFLGLFGTVLNGIIVAAMVDTLARLFTR